MVDAREDAASKLAEVYPEVRDAMAERLAAHSDDNAEASPPRDFPQGYEPTGLWEVSETCSILKYPSLLMRQLIIFLADMFTDSVAWTVFMKAGHYCFGTDFFLYFMDVYNHAAL